MGASAFDRSRRTGRTASSWMKRAVAVLRWEHEHASPATFEWEGVEILAERWLVGYEAEVLLRDVLQETEALVALLNDGADLEQLSKWANDVVLALGAREAGTKRGELAGKIRALDERGSTEGERAAARAALVRLGEEKG